MTAQEKFLCGFFYFWRLKIARNPPVNLMVNGAILLYIRGMENLLNRLEQIGVEPETIEAIRINDDREAALLLIAMFDDWHEYVD